MKFDPPLTKVFDNEEQWNKGRYAVSQDDCGVEPSDPSAIKWCLVGRLCKVYKISVYGSFLENIENFLSSILEKNFNRDCIVSWNDDPSTTFKDVEKLLELAQQESDKEGQLKIV